MPIVFYTTVDDKYDKLTTVVGRTNSSVLATVDGSWRNLSESRVCNKVPERSTLLFDIPEFPSSMLLR